MITETILTAAVTSGIKSLVEKQIAPQIDKFAKKMKYAYKDLLIPKGEHFEEYLNRSYGKYGIINTLVFHNSQRRLKDIYVAQTLKKSNYLLKDEETVIIDRLPVELIKKYKKILITDTAGMGKSTIMKRMFIDLIDQGMSEVGIPIYIELNKLSTGHSVLQEIQEELSSLSEEFDKDMLLKFIQVGGFLFFMDGYDEISIADKNKVTDDIQNFISKAGRDNYYILTSRPEDSLTSFGDFQLFSIQPLLKEEAFDLLKKYDMSENKAVSEKLVELLKSSQYYQIDEYLVNPLLVSLLFTAYDYNQSIPLEKHRFYGLVFEAYFEKHDNTKPIKPRDKLSGLNYDGFNRILRYVGFECLMRIGVKFSERIILDSIHRAKVSCGNLVFSESDFLKDLITSVPLFCREGTDYKWIHKSLLEYFAAYFVFCDAKQKQDEILTKIYNSDSFEKYINMLDIYYDIDFKGFSKNITLPLCEKYIQFHDKNYKTITSNIIKELKEERISCLFLNDIAFTHSNKNDSNKVEKAFNLLGLKKPMFIIYPSNKNDNKCIYISIRNNANILHLLFDKKSSIVTEKSISHRNKRGLNQLEDIYESFKQNKIYNIDMNTGDESDNMYSTINFMIEVIKDLNISYLACRNEVDRIKKEIAQNNIIDDLLSNL